jgi:hypothetical protein
LLLLQAGRQLSSTAELLLLLLLLLLPLLLLLLLLVGVSGRQWCWCWCCCCLGQLCHSIRQLHQALQDLHTL